MKITTVARTFRRRQTKAEEKFWNLVRNRKFLGKKFLRQYPIRVIVDRKQRWFIADFYCSEFKLVVEIDGEIHGHQKGYDNYRTYILNEKGYRVIRFTNNEVLQNINSVEARLGFYLKNPLSNA